MKLAHIAPTSFPTNLGTGGAEKVAFEFDSVMHDQIDMLTIAHPNTNTEVFKGPVIAESLEKRNREHVLSIIREGGFDTALIHMTRTKELNLALSLEIPCTIIVHIAPEIAGHMLYNWMDLMAQCIDKGIPIYAVSKTHAKRLTKSFHTAREYVKKNIFNEFTALASASKDIVIDKYILTHYVSSELIKPVIEGDGSLCTVSRISAAAPPNKLFFFHDELNHPVKLITNMSNITSAKDMAAHEKYYKKYGELFRIDLDRDSIMNEVRASTATVNPIAIDSSPCKVFESNALGVPVIIFDNNGVSGALDLQLTDHFAVIQPQSLKKDRINAYSCALDKVLNLTLKNRIELAMATRSFFTKERLIQEYFNILNTDRQCVG